MARRFFWSAFNHTYGPWYRMYEIRDSALAQPLVYNGHAAEAVVQPDMDREGWFWAVRFSKYTPKLLKADKIEGKKMPKPKIPLTEYKVGGRVQVPGEAGRLEAMRLAQEAFIKGRPR